jgi:hypothetical protein
MTIFRLGNECIVRESESSLLAIESALACFPTSLVSKAHVIPILFYRAADRVLAFKGETSPSFYFKSEVRVVSFDLDNTIWNTSACINAANDALAAFLDADRIVLPKRVEVIMGDLFQASKSTYCPLDENAKAPVLLTQLRIDAVCHSLVNHNGYSETDAEKYAEKAFQVWTKARHAAIPHNFATSVLSCLEKISSIRTSAGHPVLIGAITDGNSGKNKKTY